jgi:4-hydroxy-tetrahydrodipicolinate reductase
MTSGPESATRRIRVAVNGALGRMGLTTCEAVMAEPDLELVAAVDPVFADRPCPGTPAFSGARCAARLPDALQVGDIDVVVDFTTPAAVRENILTCIGLHVPVVVGTTGLTAANLAEIDREAAVHSVPVLVAPNFAMGAVLMMQFAQQAAMAFRACEIIELHHDRKVDAPSGTSKLTRTLIEQVWNEGGETSTTGRRDVPIHSVRLPGLVAHQEVIFGGPGETLTIRHDSLSRESFMPGVLTAIKRIGRLQGLVVGLENIL